MFVCVSRVLSGIYNIWKQYFSYCIISVHADSAHHAVSYAIGADLDRNTRLFNAQ